MNIFSAFPTHVANAVPSLADRIFPVNGVENFDTPYCSYQKTHSNPLQTLDGFEGEISFDYQFNFYDESFDTADDNANTFWEYIKNYTGAFGDYILEEVEFLTSSESSDLVASRIRFNAILEIRFKCILT